ncbi:hypothetical protein APHAL10511_000318 [Amanita phalloides]|nr:hypothetical protein APHAL10511_000318 [Amanita phalloides]
MNPHLLFPILFACVSCAPTQSSTTPPYWKPFPSQNKHAPLPQNLPSIRPLNSLGSPSGTSRANVPNLMGQLPPPPTDPPAVQSRLGSPGGTCGVEQAWKDRGKLIHGWPDVDEAHETTFEGKPAVITKVTVSLAKKRLLSNDLRALDVTGQLFKYSTERNRFRTTYYIVRTTQKGDTWQAASDNGLSVLKTKPLIAIAKNYYQRQYGIVLEQSKDEQGLYDYFKNTKGEYVRAFLISFRRSSLVPHNKLRKVNPARFCVEKWK